MLNANATAAVPEDPNSSLLLPPAGYPTWDPAVSVLSFERRSLHPEIVWHQHPHPELTLILQGRGRRGVDGAIEPYEQGDLCLVPEGSSHGWEHHSGGEEVLAVVVHFSRAALGSALSAPELSPVRALFDGSAGALAVAGATRELVAAQILKLAAEPRASWRRPLLLLEALGLLAGSPDTRSLGLPDSVVRRRRADPRVHAVLKYIEMGQADSVTHAEAAAVAQLTPASFSRFFKKALGRTFEDYVNEVRISRACNALAEPGRSVIDIAFDVGFNSVAHFNRRFRHVKGMTPTEYRRRLGPDRSTLR